MTTIYLPHNSMLKTVINSNPLSVVFDLETASFDDSDKTTMYAYETELLIRSVCLQRLIKTDIERAKAEGDLFPTSKYSMCTLADPDLKDEYITEEDISKAETIRDFYSKKS